MKKKVKAMMKPFAINLRIESKLAEKLDEYSKHYGSSKNWILNKALEQFLAKENPYANSDKKS